MTLFALIAMPLLVYFGWKTGEPLRRGRYLLIYLGVIFSMAFITWATAPPRYSYIEIQSPTSEEVGANFICIFIALWGSWKLGRRLRDTSMTAGWVAVMSVLSLVGISWLIALFYPSATKSRTRLPTSAGE